MRVLPFRSLVVAGFALSLVAAPAHAEDIDSGGLSAAVDELQDPVRQEQVGTMAEAMTRAMLAMPVGPMLRAAAEMSGEDPEAIDPDATVADLAGPDADGAADEIAERVPQMMGMMAGMAGALETMLPQLRDMAETMRRTLPETR